MEFTDAVLRNFCSGDERRPITCRPWSFGDFSYATNGTIIVRVPLVADVPIVADREKTAKMVDQWLTNYASMERVPAPRIDLPKGRSWTCDECDGRGTKHDCPDCGCDCRECDGTGRCHQPVLVAWRGTHISRENWRLVTALPGSVIAASPPLPPVHDHISFAFDGGSGIVMPMRKRDEDDPLVINAEMAEAS